MIKYQTKKAILFLVAIISVSMIFWSFNDVNLKTQAELKSISVDSELRHVLQKKYRNYSVGEMNVEHVYKLGSETTIGKVIKLNLTLPNDEAYELLIEKNDMRPKSTINSFSAVDVTTYKGKVKGIEDSDVRLSIYKNFIYGYIKLNGVEVRLEPLKDLKTNKEIDAQFLVYRVKDIIDDVKFECGVDHIEEKAKTPGNSNSRITIPFTPMRKMRIIYDCDVQFYQGHGDLSSFYATAFFNEASSFYESAMGIKFETVVGNIGVVDYGTNNAEDILNGSVFQFALNYQGWDKDIFVQLTDRNIFYAGNANSVGLAFTRTLCSNPSSAHAVVEDAHSGNITRNAIIHEIGHIMGSHHTDEGFMKASIDGTENHFDDNTIFQFAVHLTDNNSCLEEVATSTGCEPQPTCRDYNNLENREFTREVVHFYQDYLNGNVKDVVQNYIKYEDELELNDSKNEESRQRVYNDKEKVMASIMPKAFSEFVANEDRIITEEDYSLVDNLLSGVYEEAVNVEIKKEIEKIRTLLPVIKNKTIKEALIAFDNARITPEINSIESSNHFKILNNGSANPLLKVSNRNNFDECIIEVWDVKGQLVNSKIIGNLENGNHNFTLLDEPQLSGTYIARIKYAELGKSKENSSKFIMTK